MKKYHFLTSILFIAMIFVGAALNVHETYVAYTSDESPAIGELDEQLDSVEGVKYISININGMWQRLTGHRYVYDSVRSKDQLKTKDGHLVDVFPKKHEKAKIDESFNRLTNLNDYLMSRGSKLIYVQCGGRNSAMSESDFKDAVVESQDGTLDYVFGLMDKGGVEYIDSRAVLKDLGLSAYFKTDHHWTMEAALNISEAICKKAKEEGFDLDEDTFSFDSYDINIHKGVFLGAEGRRVGRFFAGLDDISVITPKCPTDFRVVVPNKGIDRSGSFEESIMDETKVIDEYSFTDSAYYMYWGGDYQLTEVTNNKAKNDYNLLIVKDSFGIPVSAFMVNSFKHTEIVDLRYYKDKNLRELIDEYNPDLVVFVYGTGYFEMSRIFGLK